MMTPPRFQEPVRGERIGIIRIDLQRGLELRGGQVPLRRSHILACQVIVHLCAAWRDAGTGGIEIQIVVPIPVAHHRPHAKCRHNGRQSGQRGDALPLPQPVPCERCQQAKSRRGQICQPLAHDRSRGHQDIRRDRKTAQIQPPSQDRPVSPLPNRPNPGA